MAPTSTGSLLWLLSAPSVRFWQQTAICPVSLWALVVELHPLNWARAQAIRRISDKVTMKELEEQRVCVCVCVCVKVCCKLGKSLQRHFNCLTKHTGRTVWAERSAASGLSVLKRAECRSVKSQAWTTFHSNKRRPCRESSAVIRGNRRLTFREVADEVGISIGSCHQIFTDKLQTRRFSSQFVPFFVDWRSEIEPYWNQWRTACQSKW